MTQADGAPGRHKNYSTPVADDWNWTARIRNELGANKAWQRKWGFLAEGEQGGQQGPSEPGAAAGPPPAGDALAAFMQQARASASAGATMSYIQAKQRDSARARKLNQQDSLDGFVSTYLARDPHARQLPAQEFRKPLTTSHEYGWGRNLERFGPMTLMLR